MLPLVLTAKKEFDETLGEWGQYVIVCPETEVKLEHSLLSLSKWESKWKIPYLTNAEKTPEQVMDYIYCMAIDPKYIPALGYINEDEVRAISDYINDDHTATTIGGQKGKSSNQIITSELVYAWMVQYRVPFSPCEKWHLGRLLTMLGVLGELNSPKKKQKAVDQSKRWAELNAKRRAEMSFSG